MMRAVIFKRMGPASQVLELVTDQPKPTRKAGELLIKIHSTSVNPIDFKIRGGQLRMPVGLPKIPGCDLAGVVEEADEKGQFKVGDRVYAVAGSLWGKEGCTAEYVTAPESNAAIVPPKLSFNEAASIPLAILTAWQAMDADNLKPGDRVLIHAGAGGVGCYGIQIAKAKGAFVATTCGPRNIEFVTKDLGADVAVDYTKDKFDQVFKDAPFDVVVDSVGGATTAASYNVTKKGGRFRMLTGIGGVGFYLKGSFFGMLGMGPNIGFTLAHPDSRQLREVSEMVQNGTLKPVIDRTYPLEKTSEAHEYLEKGRTRQGKGYNRGRRGQVDPD